MLGNGVGLNMTNDIDRDNEDWLLALSGGPRQGADSFTNAQAEAIRGALKRRALAIEQESPKPSESGYHRLLFRLKKEKIIGPEADKFRALREKIQNLEAANLDDFLATGTGGRIRFSRRAGNHESETVPIGQIAGRIRMWMNPALGVAAVFVIGAALLFYMQLGGHKDEDPFAVRGGIATVLIVADQNEKVMHLVDALNPLGGEVKITREADGSVLLLIKATDEVLARLVDERIQPDVKDGYIRISVVRKP